MHADQAAPVDRAREQAAALTSVQTYLLWSRSRSVQQLDRNQLIGLDLAAEDDDRVLLALAELLDTVTPGQAALEQYAGRGFG